MTSSSIYEEKPWLKSYPPGVRGEVEIPDISVNEAFDTATMKHRDRTASIFMGKRSDLTSCGTRSIGWRPRCSISG